VEFLKHTLANGLEIVAECDAEAHSMGLGYFVRTGSRDETDEVAGVSHFLEHMAFKGTPTRTADDVNREFDEMGAHYNAYTSEENTVYHAAVLPEYQEQALSLLSDILRPSLREEDFNTEKQVILEEILMYEDQPPFLADEKVKAAYFGTHPLARSVLGTSESITRLPVDAMREYFDRRYSPGNIVLAATGRVDFDALVAGVERYCGQWTPCEVNRHLEQPRPAEGFRSYRKETATQQYVLAMSAGPGAVDKDRYAAKLLANVLGDDSGSRLYWELVDSGLAEQASLCHYEYDDAGVQGTFMCCDPEYANENLERILAVYRQVEAEGVSAVEVEQAKSKFRSRIVLSSERPRSRLFSVGPDWLHRHEYRSVSDDLEAIAALTAADANAVLQKYPLTRNTTVTIGPL
jgi:predicted Zn-dependent peptidase